MKIFTPFSFSTMMLWLNLVSAICFAQPQWPFVAYSSNAVLHKDPGSWDSGIVFTPDVIIHSGTFYLFYSGSVDIFSQPTAIGMASSVDGFTFSKSDSNPVFQADGSGFDAYSVSDPRVMIDTTLWIMYYGASSIPSAGPGDYIGLATANNPEGPWIRLQDPVLTVGVPGEWDDGFILPNTVFRIDSEYVMYYSASNMNHPDGTWQIGRATANHPEGPWTKYDSLGTPGASDPVLKSTAGSWGFPHSWECSVLTTPQGYEMFYSGTDAIGYASSSDGIHWQKYAGNPIFRKEDDPHVAGIPAALVEIPGVARWNVTYYMYYDYGLNVGEIGLATAAVVTGLNSFPAIIPHGTVLMQNYPNPFNPITTIEFDLPQISEVTLKVFNILGEEVATLFSDRLAAGNYKCTWDATDFASGVYLYKLWVGGYVETKKMILMR
jgi:predicted GH43/DUF377 family glycosyl hydrolase